MAVRPFKLINHSEREMLTARLTDGIRRWSARYAPDDAQIRCVLALPSETLPCPEPREWMLATRHSAAVLAIGLPEDWPRGLAGLVLADLVGRQDPEGRRDPAGRRDLAVRQDTQTVVLDPAGLQLMRELGAGLLEELGQSVLNAALAIPAASAEGGLVWSRAPAPDLAGGPGDGRVLGHCTLGDTLQLVMTLWPETVQRCLAVEVPRSAGQAPIEPLSRALQEEAVALEGIAGEAELALEELTTLAVGDVIRLNRKISEPLEVRIRGGGVVCEARLGVSKGRTALQLARVPPELSGT